MIDDVLRGSRTLQTCVFLLLLLAERSALGQGSSVWCSPSPSGAVGWWRGENDVRNVFGSDHGVTNAWVRFSPGQVGQGILFNGTNSAVTVADSPSLNFGPAASFTVEAWIRVERTVSKYAMSILDKRLAPATLDGVPFNAAIGYTLFLVEGRLGLQLSDAPLANYRFHDFYSLGPDLRDGQFHHVAAVVDRSSVTGSRLYVDGQVVMNFDATVVPGDLTNSEPLRFGYHASPGFDGYFTGVIDEVGLYARALTADELRAIYNAKSNGKCLPEAPESLGPPRISVPPQSILAGVGGHAQFTVEADGAGPLVYQWWHNQVPILSGTNRVLDLSHLRQVDSGTYVVTIRNAFGTVTSASALLAVDPTDAPIAYWPFDEASGSTAHDVVGQTHGQLSPGATFVSNGLSGSALRLDRALNSYVTMSTNFGFENATFSIVGWIRMNPGDQTENSLVLAKHESGYGNGYFVVVNRSNPVLGSPDKIFLFAGDVFSGPTSLTSVNDGQWHQFAAIHVHDGENRMYVDGKLESSVASLPIARSPAPWLIGGALFDGAPLGLFTGSIDELQVYSRALSSEEVVALFRYPTEPMPSGFAFRRILPPIYSPGSPLAVELVMSSKPALNSAQTYTLEEIVPDGWSVLDLNPDGIYDSARHAIKFGPFTGAGPTTLRYSIKPPLNEGDIRFFQGGVIVEGKEKNVHGPASIAPAPPPPTAVQPKGQAQRILPTPPIANEWSPVTITVSPDPSAAAYAVEERVAIGLTITNISESGTYSADQRTIRWGPFFDATPRLLSYQISVAAPSLSEIPFYGAVSFDGSTEAIQGADVLRPGIRLRSPRYTVEGAFEFAVPTLGNDVYRVGISTNLRTWMVMTATNTAGLIRINNSDAAGSPQRFFRLVNE